MKFIADLHIHSHFSIATSKQCIPEYLDYWARIKGIMVVGTGDFTHPGWLKEIKEKLEPAEQGLFKLKDSYAKEIPLEYKSKSNAKVRFLLTSEISNIYKKDGKTRKVHNVIFAPDFATVEKIQYELKRIGGNITSDGRPILGLDSRDLLEIALNSSENIFFVPAHIWTPWFSALGAKSGFDTIEECYGDLADNIYTVETGLSSDPPMNWICSFLDRYTLISNSDAHSPQKLGREANLFDTELSYNSIVNALKTGNPEQFLGTVEFFPQEGKYHYDGHRKCEIVWNPLETLQHNCICPVCNKRVTVGVMNRILQLSDRENILELKNRIPFHSTIPLKELLSEIVGVSPNCKSIDTMYLNTIKKIGSEFDILLNLPIEDIKKAGNEILSEAIKRMRNGEVFIKEGYDGEYGQIKVFQEYERRSFGQQESLFDNPDQKKYLPKQQRKMINFDLEEYRHLEKMQDHQRSSIQKTAEPVKSYIDSSYLEKLNPQQRIAVDHFYGPALVLAGPGTGKTQVLTFRIAELIKTKGIDPQNILAVTFTNKAAKEMKDRIYKLLKNGAKAGKLHISTFHSFGYSILKKHCDKIGRDKDFLIIHEDEKRHVLLNRINCEKNRVKQISILITEIKQGLKPTDAIEDEILAEQFKNYEAALQKQNAFDLDDLIFRTVCLFREHPDICNYYRDKFQWIMIDEYQDINFAQYQMIRYLLPDKNANLYVIGDPNQAIYGFRGADVTFIKTFIENFPEARFYSLKKSYRCSEFILKASSQVIQDKSAESCLLEGINRGVKITIAYQNTARAEAEYIARTIEEMIGGLRFFSIDSRITEGDRNAEITSLADFAVLCRLNRQIEPIEKAFNDHSIPFQTIRETPFFKQEPVKSIINILKISINPQKIFLRDSLVAELGITNQMIEEILDIVRHQESVQEKIKAIINNCFPILDIRGNALFEELIDICSGYRNDSEQFVNFTDLGTGIDIYKPETESVALMTLHAAKGLEFECVFIAGCEDGIIPYSLIENRVSDYDEEKRLLYVGMTRAKRFLILSHARKRFIYGREYNLKRSPFISNIENGLIELSEREYKRKEKEEDIQLSLF